MLSTFSEILAVLVLTVYFLAGLPAIKLFAYKLVPHSRRPRVILITDQIIIKVGGYVLGNFITSVIAGLGRTLDGRICVRTRCCWGCWSRSSISSP